MNVLQLQYQLLYLWVLPVSIMIHEKIRLIREGESLSRPAFSEMTDVPVRTLEAIENKGNIPRADVLEKICAIWPQYSYWLLTNEVHYPRHIAPNPNDANNSVLRFFSHVENLRPEEDSLMTKPEWFNKLVFLQCIDEKNDLKAFIEVKNPPKRGLKECILIGGNINFCSNDKGKKGLINIARYLESVNRSDLIKTSELKLINRNSLNELFKCFEIDEYKLIDFDLADTDWLKKIKLNYSDWKSQKTDYDPEYNWKNMGD